jgi:hypothetical protein
VRASEFINESSKLRKSAKNAIPGMTINKGLDNNNNPYLAYRFGVALASSPNGDMEPNNEIGSNFTMIDYTDAGAEIRKHAEKVMGQPSSKKTSSDSHELDSVNKVSPTANRPKDFRKK